MEGFIRVQVSGFKSKWSYHYEGSATYQEAYKEAFNKYVELINAEAKHSAIGSKTVTITMEEDDASTGVKELKSITITSKDSI